MGAITVSAETAELLEHQVSIGRCDSATAFIEEAVRRLVEDADADDDELAAHIAAGEADIAAGRFILVESEEDERRLRERRMARLNDSLGSPP